MVPCQVGNDVLIPGRTSTPRTCGGVNSALIVALVTALSLRRMWDTNTSAFQPRQCSYRLGAVCRRIRRCDQGHSHASSAFSAESPASFLSWCAKSVGSLWASIHPDRGHIAPGVAQNGAGRRDWDVLGEANVNKERGRAP